MRKRIYYLLLPLLLLSGCSKEYDDSALNGRLDGLEERVEALEELCRQMNTNISSLQTIVTALQSNDYITNVSPVTSGGKTVGYTITFAKNGAITIYHGEDGKDAVTPKLGVRQDTDGIYYWTLDGEWLTDDHGNKIQAQGGSDQESMPRLKIENGYWFVSYGESGSWQQLGKATGEDGDSMFEKVEQDDEYVYITLAGETEAIAIPKKITLRIEFTEGAALQFAENETKQIHYSVIADHSDRIVVKAEMLNQDGAYTLRTEPTSASSGTITVTAANPTINRIIVTVSDGKHTIMEAIDVSKIGVVVLDVSNPGALSDLLQNYDRDLIVDLKVTGNLNDDDISAINNLPNLQKLDLGEANIERLPDRAFYKKQSLSSIVLPKTLKVIGGQAFYSCSGLTGPLTIPEGVTTIRDATFENCSGLTGPLTISKGVTTIGGGAFRGCSGLTGNLVIPESVTTIKGDAFYGCSGLTGPLTIPEGVTTIWGEAFRGCSGLTGNLVIPEGVTTIEKLAFYQCSGFTGNLVIPEGVTTIKESAFSGCSGFTGNLVIPGSVTTIESYAFDNCKGLTGNLVIPEGVTTIGESAFVGCSGFTGDLIIPEGVTTIGSCAFYHCKFKNVYCKATVPPQIGSSAFDNLSGKTLYIPVGSKDAYLNAERWNELKFKEIIEMQF